MKKKEAIKKTLLYLLSIAYVEAVLVVLFFMGVIANDFDWSVWRYFAWVQLPVPIISLVIFAFILAEEDKNEEAARKSEWIGRVNKMLEEYEKEKEK